MHIQPEPYYNLVGAIIRQSIQDYSSRGGNDPQNQREAARHRHEAQNFLFTDRLEQFLKFFEIDQLVSTKKIRTEAMKCAA